MNPINRLWALALIAVAPLSDLPKAGVKLDRVTAQQQAAIQKNVQTMVRQSTEQIRSTTSVGAIGVPKTSTVFWRPASLTTLPPGASFARS